jgi:hypothetical protein
MALIDETDIDDAPGVDLVPGTNVTVGIPQD